MRDRQINEMAKDLIGEIEYDTLEHFYSVDDRWTEVQFDYTKTAEHLIDKGYVKASDVAREIVTEFANMLKCHSFYMSDEYGEVNELVVTAKAINEIEAELKKKYESEAKR